MFCRDYIVALAFIVPFVEQPCHWTGDLSDTVIGKILHSLSVWCVELTFYFFNSMLKEYPQSNIYRVPPNYSPVSSQMMHPAQPTLWGYNLMGQPQQPGFFLQNQSLTPGMWRAQWGCSEMRSKLRFSWLLIQNLQKTWKSQELNAPWTFLSFSPLKMYFLILKYDCYVLLWEFSSTVEGN